ncbi:MAG: vanadium-dependent haloperoxidase [Saprospiraceae bacterium]|nr:vanadium-dependent haloperoxidase [Saprospiraceae bacterium]
MKFKYCFVVLFLVLLFSHCNERADSKLDPNLEMKLAVNEHIHDAVNNLTDIIVHDIFSPPVASRVYVYPCIAAYEIMAMSDENYVSLKGQLNGFDGIYQPENKDGYSPSLAALHAFNTVGEKLIFSEDKMEEFKTQFYAKLDSFGIPSNIWDNSLAYGDSVATLILDWASEDNYNQLRSMPKYSINDDPGTWKPTPPAYMEGIEPNWREVRTMVIDSSSQFPPVAPPPFSMDKSSKFYKLTEEVKDAVNNATEEHKLIASFWDCNPFVMNQTGHMMFATKKITPGGHWMGITMIANRKSNQNLMGALENLTTVSIMLFDAFISCWDEKYRSNLIRPETVINEYLDPDWLPILQTPPFPEHTSGHSVISTASAVALTTLLGDNFDFVDDVETKYGLPIRAFDSFYDASNEAAISRLYGGIHYMPAITDGVAQGKKLGNYVMSKLETKNTNS